LDNYSFKFKIRSEFVLHSFFISYLASHPSHFSICVTYSPRKRERRRVLTQEHKDLPHMLGVFRQEFDKLKELVYEWQTLEKEEQQYRKD